MVSAILSTRNPARNSPTGISTRSKPRAKHSPCDLRHAQTRAAISRQTSAHAAAAHRAQSRDLRHAQTRAAIPRRTSAHAAAARRAHSLRPSAHADPCRNSPTGISTRSSRTPRTAPATFGTRRPVPQFPANTPQNHRRAGHLRQKSKSPCAMHFIAQGKSNSQRPLRI